MSVGPCDPLFHPMVAIHVINVVPLLSISLINFR